MPEIIHYSIAISALQLTMLLPPAEPESARDRRLASAVDRINEKLGEKAIRPARLIGQRGRR